MKQTEEQPEYDKACRAIADFLRDFEVAGDAIGDPCEQLAYYAAIASNTEPERMMREIRERAERMACEMLGYKPKRRRR